MLKHVMAVAAVSAFALTQRAGAANVAARIFAAPGRRPPRRHRQARARRPRHLDRATGKFVTKQTSDQYLTSKFKGTDVVGADDKKIGDVSDILFDKDKKILAYIVGVGGFLGIGSKDVAVEPASFQLVPGSSATDFKLRLSMTADELKAAPAFEPYTDPRPATTSSNAPATRPMGAPAPMAPTPKQ